MNQAAVTSDEESDSIKNEDFSPEQLQEYTNFIRQRAQILREANSRTEEIFKKIKILNDELKLVPCLGESLTNLEKVLTDLETRSLSSEKAELSQAERLRKHNNHLSKLKLSIRHYSNLNENIVKEIKFLRCELDHSNVNDQLKLHPEDLQRLEEKAKKYENDLMRFEKKYPWLKQADYDLPDLAKQFNTLKSLKEEKDQLLKELSVYQNLKPDIKEAKQQLAELKEEVKSANDNFKM